MYDIFIATIEFYFSCLQLLAKVSASSQSTALGFFLSLPRLSKAD